MRSGPIEPEQVCRIERNYKAIYLNMNQWEPLSNRGQVVFRRLKRYIVLHRKLFKEGKILSRFNGNG